jgi:integrase
VASIQRRPDGAWRARFRDREGRERARHFARRVDAQRWLDEVTAALVTGTYVDPRAGRILLGGFYREFADRQVWQTNTRAAMDLAVRSAGLADVPIGSIRRSHIESWVKRMTADGLAPGTVVTRVRNLRAVLRAAVKDKVIASDPAADVTLPRVRRPEAAMTIPTPEQVGALLEATDPVLRAGVALGAFAGLRLGEVLGAQVGDIGFLPRVFTVTRQVQRPRRGVVEVRPPKYGSERVVYLPDELLVVLGRHVEQLPAGVPDRWLFPGEDPARPVHRGTLAWHWDRAREAAGVPTLHFHSLRHFFASGLIAAGCDVVTVQRAMGHKSATVTLRVYAHLWPSAEDRTRSAAAQLMAVVGGAADSVRTTVGMQPS